VEAERGDVNTGAAARLENRGPRVGRVEPAVDANLHRDVAAFGESAGGRVEGGVGQHSQRGKNDGRGEQLIGFGEKDGSRRRRLRWGDRQ
jgi:hypothetical protein